jgi:WD40 repeat protein
VAFLPDGRRAVTASWDKTVKVWDLTTRLVIRVMTGHTDQIRGIAVSHDGASLATASFDGTIGMWDLMWSRERVALQQPGGKVHAVAFAPRGVLMPKTEPVEAT